MHAENHEENLNFDAEGIEAELAFLQQVLERSGDVDGEGLSEVELVAEALADAAPRDRYRPVGPAIVKVAAIGLATFPAALAPVPAFANEPMPENMMLALAQRPEAPPALAAQGTQLFPFSSRMQNLRNQVASAPVAHVATSHLAPKGTHVSTPSPSKRFALNPRLKTLFAESRQVAVTTKRGPASTFYQVGKGDSLYSIAADLLGSGARWREIYAANHGSVSSSYLLKVGQRLVIPGSRPIEAAPVMMAHAKPMPQNSPKGNYKVAPGDSLYTIARKRLGNPQRWREIVAMNKASLQGKTVIYPNQWLTLPQQG